MSRKKNGFTLVELIVVIVILGIFISLALIVINPIKQINKAQDAQRLHDLGQIQVALDSYYNDHNLFPQDIPFGQAWTENNTIYMKKIPQDPVYPLQQYLYFADQNSSTQWAVVFAKLAENSKKKMCNLADTCLPSDYTTQWACKVSGTPDCNILNAFKLSNQPVVSSNTCQFNYEVFPTKPNEMLAYLYKDDAHFLIYKPPFQGTPSPWLGTYSIDVSTSPDFSGPSCDGNLVNPGDSANCATYYNFGHAWNSAGWIQSEFGDYAYGSTFISPNYPNSGNYTYPALINITSNYKSPTNNYKDITDIWSKYQCGKTIYWRLSDIKDKLKVTAIHADTISCEVPDRIPWSTWRALYCAGIYATNECSYQISYSAKWDINCNGKMDQRDAYLLEYEGLLYPEP